MKINDLYETELLTDKDEIIQYMKESFRQFDPTLLEVEPDGLVYDGRLWLNSDIHKLKIQFKSVNGDFMCNASKITSLENVPQTVNGHFYCDNNNISSLRFCPKMVKNVFYCGDIKITDPKEYRFVLYCEIGMQFNSGYAQINEIINTYRGSDNRKYWAHAINLLSRVKL